MMTKNKGTASNEMAPAQVSSHTGESNRDRKIIQQSSQQMSRIKAGGGEKQQQKENQHTCLLGMTWQANRKQTYCKQICPQPAPMGSERLLEMAAHKAGPAYHRCRENRC